MDGETLQALFLFIRDGIFSSVFLWLLIREQLSHAETRNDYRRDLRDIALHKIGASEKESDE
jgi:hypothetical protein